MYICIQTNLYKILLLKIGCRRLQSTYAAAKANTKPIRIAFPSAKTQPPPTTTTNASSVPLSKKQLRMKMRFIDEPLSIIHNTGSRILMFKVCAHICMYVSFEYLYERMYVNMYVRISECED